MGGAVKVREREMGIHTTNVRERERYGYPRRQVEGEEGRRLGGVRGWAG